MRGVVKQGVRACAAGALAIVAAVGLSGCVSAAKTVVTAPFKVASQGVDWATTSQDEADRNRGREIRKQEEREAKERRKREREAREAAERRDD
jgi:cytochrome bd-type quinol oxidase subunit 1